MQDCTVKKTILLLLSMSLVSINSYGGDKKIYSWKDKHGVLVFSDSPRAGAQEIKLSSQNLSMPAVDITVLNEDKPAAVVNFKIVIASPTNEETVRENTGSVYVTSRIVPRFESGFKIQLLVDGVAFAKPSNTGTFALRDVNRGEHTLQLKLFNSEGSVVSVSESSTFFMHRASSL
ncbi:hypothetical protein AMS58_20645 [Pseudoalteromonas porphyrae]|uniref:DUF4124 domain-containing protein n=1 Tax=Pseudoalteromonas porphyrae TaxID=187330 RepID=A0A0N1MWK8_9GAMM|nr:MULTISPECIES: DUF4124 domain-containing protein [unclassified Pseudoalteromonas]KPH65274.1 hypothetical protein ADS77_03125 [Pseudoalteromonas porphyrae]KPH92809.1 hypothetical protein AMS58_20645 [Pseudoalteromonas porphyrae]NMR27272.1 DUF4124 domain-containing protein [Pseudoalteromonas sp. NEC-BIFX-2020_015]NNG44015.1 DUF4124 domain-containing protein [Pseudoalteromonas sp. NEC-BIFX-2020_002]